MLKRLRKPISNSQKHPTLVEIFLLPPPCSQLFFHSTFYLGFCPSQLVVQSVKDVVVPKVLNQRSLSECDSLWLLESFQLEACSI